MRRTGIQQLAAVHERELKKGNRNRATLAVARRLVAYMLAVDKKQADFKLPQRSRQPERKQTHTFAEMTIFPPVLAVLGTVHAINAMQRLCCFEAGGLTQTQSSAEVIQG